MSSHEQAKAPKPIQGVTSGVTPTSLQWARILRTAESLNLGDSIIHEMRDRLLLHLQGAPAAPIPASIALPSAATSERSLSGAVAAPATKPTQSAEKIPPRPAVPVSAKSTQLELKIRQLIEANATWTDIADYAAALLQLKDDDETRARLLETAFLYGNNQEIEIFLQHLMASGKTFYRLVHGAVRAQLLLRLWSQHLPKSLGVLLFAEREAEYLLPIERFYIFALGGQKPTDKLDRAGLYIYYQRYWQQIVAAAQEHGHQVAYSPARLWLAAGTLALQLGYEEDARRIFKNIEPQASEHDEALQLLLQKREPSRQGVDAQTLTLRLAHQTPKERLALLRELFETTRRLGGIRDHNRPALNDLLQNPLEWCPLHLEDSAELSLLLVQNRDLRGLLPNLYAVFHLNATRFYSPSLDTSLWQGHLRYPVDQSMNAYWHGVALLHHYVSCGPEHEALLWQARAAVIKAKKDPSLALPYGWRDLHKAAMSWVAKSPYLMEADRTPMLKQLRIAGDTEHVSAADIQDYIVSRDQPQPLVLVFLRRLCAEKRQYELELKVVQKSGQVSHYTNQDLSRVWQLAGHLQLHDLAWRAASVLQARQALSKSVRHAWEISGEKRSHYALQVLSEAAIPTCLNGLSDTGARLAHATVTVGPLLPELLELLDPKLILMKPSAAPVDSIELQIEKHLAAHKWLGKPRRPYRLLHDGKLGATSMPAFMQVLPINTWSLLLARLTDLLGINAWAFKLSKLGMQINELIPRLASRQDLRKQSGKIARWLRELTPEQRTAWQDLGTLARHMDDREATEVLGRFLSRLAVLLLPNHWQALTSLQVMRVPVAILWDLEAFILSEDYSALRQQLGLQHRALVPNSLQRLESVVEV